MGPAAGDIRSRFGPRRFGPVSGRVHGEGLASVGLRPGGGERPSGEGAWLARGGRVPNVAAGLVSVVRTGVSGDTSGGGGPSASGIAVRRPRGSGAGSEAIVATH